jgi:spermidine synthase
MSPDRSPGLEQERGAITLSETDGVRYLHFGTEWVQGAMCIAHPIRLELEYQQLMIAPMLFCPRPRAILQLGLGAAALTKFCHRRLRDCSIVAVDRSREVVRTARQWFALPPDDDRLRVVVADAKAYLRGAAASADWLQVDLYDAQARGPVFEDRAFYRSCRNSLREGGVAAFNIFGGRLRQNLGTIAEVFERRVIRLPRSAAGNCVVLGFQGAPCEWSGADLRRRAARMEERLHLPAGDWLEGLRGVDSRRLEIVPGGTVRF